MWVLGAHALRSILVSLVGNAKNCERKRMLSYTHAGDIHMSCTELHLYAASRSFRAHERVCAFEVNVYNHIYVHIDVYLQIGASSRTQVRTNVPA